jgi:hypothetical protein
MSARRRFRGLRGSSHVKHGLKFLWPHSAVRILCGRRFCSFNEEKLQNRYLCGEPAAMSKIRRQL